jgi:indoleacetamide hydrolase
MHSGRSDELHEPGLAAAARAIRLGEVSSEAYVGTLLERAHEHADLKAFITIDAALVLQAARQADRFRLAGRTVPLLGVPLGVKDSYLTKGLATTFGTSVLTGFKPARDAVAVVQLKDAGAIVFGKNNLVEMSYGLTGLNEHHGQVKNPYNKAHVTGGSSSGAGASVAARIIPAALGGDTVGSIRVPPRCVVWWDTSRHRDAGRTRAWRRYPTPSTRLVSSLAALKTAILWTPSHEES